MVGESFSPELNDYQTRLKGVLDVPVNPENIEQYASDALDRLIDIVGTITADYNLQTGLDHDSPKQTEQAAFEYFGLTYIEQLLDHISDKANEISSLDKVIDGTLIDDTEILPPDAGRAPVIGDGGHRFEKAEMVPRLKTLLFIISNAFDIDVKDPTQLLKRQGFVTSNTVRNISYFALSIPNLNRTILVSDEEENATFVLDSARALKLGYDFSDIHQFTKNDLKQLFLEQPNIGRRIIYSADFTDNIIFALNDLSETQTAGDSIDIATQSRFLYPPASKNIKRAGQIAEELGVDDATVARAIEELSDVIGNVPIYGFEMRGRRSHPGFDEVQQFMIMQYLDKKGTLAEQAPPEISAAAHIAEAYRIAHDTVYEAIDDVRPLLGKVLLYRFFTTYAPGYTVGQVATIVEQLEANGKLVPEAPPDVWSQAKIAKEWGLAAWTISTAIEEIKDNLGTIKLYRFIPRRTNGYDPSQRAILRQHLEERGTLMKPPEYVISTMELAEVLGVSRKILDTTIKEIGLDYGERKLYKFTSKGLGNTPHQQVLARRRLIMRGTLRQIPMLPFEIELQRQLEAQV